MLKTRYPEIVIAMMKKEVDMKTIAKWFGVTVQAVYNKFRGQTPFTMREADILCLKLGIDGADFYRLFCFQAKNKLPLNLEHQSVESGNSHYDFPLI